MNEKFRALQKLGAGDFEHLNGSLISHLKATRSILRRWGAASVLCDAGLYHAAYGTDGFSQSMVSLSQRKEIASLVGAQAEALVYLYCSCDRSYVFPKLSSSTAIAFRDRFSGRDFVLSSEQAEQFCELTVANEMELMYANQDFKAQYGVKLLALFNSMQSHLSSQAVDAYSKALLSARS